VLPPFPIFDENLITFLSLGGIFLAPPSPNFPRGEIITHCTPLLPVFNPLFGKQPNVPLFPKSAARSRPFCCFCGFFFFFFYLTLLCCDQSLGPVKFLFNSSPPLVVCLPISFWPVLKPLFEHVFSPFPLFPGQRSGWVPLGVLSPSPSKSFFCLSRFPKLPFQRFLFPPCLFPSGLSELEQFLFF